MHINVGAHKFREIRLPWRLNFVRQRLEGSLWVLGIELAKYHTSGT